MTAAHHSDVHETPERPDRRARRRQETIEEILDIAVDVMTEEGVTGLSLSEVARRLGIQPPSLYKYFPSLMAVYDALYGRATQGLLEAVRTTMADATPGLDAVRRGLDASGRWSIDNRALAQLSMWRPVPSFTPSAESFAPSQEMVELIKGALADAVTAGELGPQGGSDEALYLVSTMITGVLTQAMANEPEEPWGAGRFSPALATLLDLLPAAYPPPDTGQPRRSRRRRVGT
jgi:AcrR family transcriptional regulator